MTRSLVIMFLLLMTCVFGLTTQSKKLKQNTPNCYLYYLDDTTNTGFMLYGDGSSYPTCPSSYSNLASNWKGMYCASNVQQSNNFVSVVANNWGLMIPQITTGSGGLLGNLLDPLTGTSTTEPVSAPQNNLIDYSFDNSAGSNKVLLKMNNHDPTYSQLWCSSTTDQSSYQPADANTCYGFASEKSTYCVYSKSACTIDGFCHMDTLSSQVHLQAIKPYFPGVISNTDLYMTFV